MDWFMRFSLGVRRTIALAITHFGLHPLLLLVQFLYPPITKQRKDNG